MAVVVRLKPLPQWWVWRPGVELGPAVRAARHRDRIRRARGLLPVAVLMAVVLVVLARGWWLALGLSPFGLMAVLVLPQRVSEWDVVLAARERDVVHCGQFADVDQRRRARKLCEGFLAVRERGDVRVAAQVEVLLWRALVALRDSLPVRESLQRVENRPGLAAAVAERTRELGELDRRLDLFASALRIAVEESDPESAAGALRRVAAQDPI